MARTDNPQKVQYNFFEDHVVHAGLQTQKAIRSSWAEPFRERLFPKIEEALFDPLYSTQGRPASPTNVLVGACMLQLLLGIQEDELFLRMLTDLTFQYALHRTTDEKLPFSKTTFRRFKIRLIHHFEETGDDLFRNCCQDVLEKMKKEEKPVPRFLRKIGRMTVQNLYSQNRKETAQKAEEAGKSTKENGQKAEQH